MRNDTKLDVLWEEVEELKKSSGSDLPDVSAADNGKILGVVNGAWNKMDAPSGAIDYSTTEQYTGLKWIDGKSIYKKTFNVGQLTNGTKQIAHDITNLEFVVFSEGFCNNGSYTLPIPYVTTDIQSVIGLATNGTNIEITSSGRTDYSAYVTIYYTKETTTKSKKKKPQNKED